MDAPLAQIDMINRRLQRSRSPDPLHRASLLMAGRTVSSIRPTVNTRRPRRNASTMTASARAWSGCAFRDPLRIRRRSSIRAHEHRRYVQFAAQARVAAPAGRLQPPLHFASAFLDQRQGLVSSCTGQCVAGIRIPCAPGSQLAVSFPRAIHAPMACLTQGPSRWLQYPVQPLYGQAPKTFRFCLCLTVPRPPPAESHEYRTTRVGIGTIHWVEQYIHLHPGWVRRRYMRLRLVVTQSGRGFVRCSSDMCRRRG